MQVKIFLGIGIDREKIYLEKVLENYWLIHCEGNSESPFIFSNEKDARHFADFLIMERIGEL